MRLISQDMRVDIPYDLVSLIAKKSDFGPEWVVTAKSLCSSYKDAAEFRLGYYSTRDRAENAVAKLHVMMMQISVMNTNPMSNYAKRIDDLLPIYIFPKDTEDLDKSTEESNE